MKTLLTSILLLTFSIAANADISRPSPEPRPRVEFQTWGGEGISMQVMIVHRKHGDEVSASIRLNCAQAQVEKVILDGQGGFLGRGQYLKTPGRPNPENPPKAQPIHVAGYAQKGVMTLVGFLDSDASKSKSFLLKKGAEGHVELCE